MAFIEAFAIKITQPLGEFFLTSFPADKLQLVSFVEELMYVDSSGRQQGNQRKKDPNRLREITRYIDSVEMSFPNSIILGANYTEEGLVLKETEEDEGTDISEIEWRADQVDGNLYRITVPTDMKLASIIDGQHRVLAFAGAKPERQSIELPCAIFFDLPNAYQAFLFATINGNQKSVNRSLALEQFGFNVDDESEKSWTPEKLAVYLSRKLNIKEESPFYRRIKIAPNDPKKLFVNKTDWYVSMATLVDGILALVSSKPKRDRVEMAQEKILGGRSRSMVKSYSDNAPLRNWFLEGRDDDIYQVVKTFFNVVNELLWTNPTPRSYIVKTVGILALFDLLKRILQSNPVANGLDFRNCISKVRRVDFSDNLFQASGVGRSRIRAVLLSANGFDVRLSENVWIEIDRLLADS